MTLPMIIALAVTVLMIILIMVDKLPFGAPPLLALLLLVVFGVTDIKTAFGGFANPTIVMLASFMAIIAALQKTSFIVKFKQTMFNMASKGGFKAYVLLILIVMLGCSLFGTGSTAYYVLVIGLLSTLPYSKQLPPSRVLMPAGFAANHPLLPFNTALQYGIVIAQNRQEQENLRKSELRTLQAQINPHFLYNTLDAIVWQAEAGHSSEVIHITRALSDFFRISLSSGADWIPLAQELKHLSGYLSIQKARYRDILNYRIDVPDELGESYVLKLLLQPLVENAIYHGIKDKRGGGLITVTGREDGGFLCFRVEDTGRGMTPDQLRDVRARMRGELPPAYAPYANAGTGFGLNNVDRRIRLYYDQEEGLSIESGPEGTCVSFRVPRKTREEIVDG